jgi:hypothetical protein
MISVRNTKSGRRYDVRLRDPSGRVYTRTFTTKRDAETSRPKKEPTCPAALGSILAVAL